MYLHLLLILYYINVFKLVLFFHQTIYFVKSFLKEFFQKYFILLKYTIIIGLSK